MGKYAENLAQVMQGARKGYPKYFDLSDPLQRSVVSEYFGGEEVMQAQYPLLYQSYCNAVEQGLGEVSNEGFQNGAVIYYGKYNQETGKIEAAGKINFTGRVKHVFASINIMHGEEIIKQYNEAHSNCSTVDIQCETNQITEQADEEYVVNLFVIWESGESNKLQCMATGTQEINLTNAVIFTNPVAEMTLYHPTKKINGEHKSYSNQENVDLSKEIIVAYNRKSETTTDYMYSTQYDEKGKMKVLLDVDYSFLLCEGVDYKRCSDFTAYLFCDGRGVLFYNGSEPLVKFIEHNGQQEYRVTLDTDWNTVIPESITGTNRVFRLFLQHYMILRDGKQTFNYHVTVSNLDKNNHEGNSEILAADLHLYWGCLAEDTKILMADGSEKEIQTLQIGEKVLNSKGEIVEIGNIIEGTEEKIYRTYTESGKLISASLLHPFAAEQGDLLLRDFDYKTRLKIKDKDQYVYETVVNCYPEEYEGKVYSLELVDTGKEKTIIADGFVTYDNSEVQRIMEENYVPEDIVLSEEEQQQFDKLKDMLEQRNAEY